MNPDIVDHWEKIFSLTNNQWGILLTIGLLIGGFAKWFRRVAKKGMDWLDTACFLAFIALVFVIAFLDTTIL